MQVWVQGDATLLWGHRIGSAGDAVWESALCMTKSTAMSSCQQCLFKVSIHES